MADEPQTDGRPQTTEKRSQTEGEAARRGPAAGPHAKPELTNPDATPGAGSLPDERGDGDADGGTG